MSTCPESSVSRSGSYQHPAVLGPEPERPVPVTHTRRQQCDGNAATGHWALHVQAVGTLPLRLTSVCCVSRGPCPPGAPAGNRSHAVCSAPRSLQWVLQPPPSTRVPAPSAPAGVSGGRLLLSPQEGSRSLLIREDARWPVPAGGAPGHRGSKQVPPCACCPPACPAAGELSGFFFWLPVSMR